MKKIIYGFLYALLGAVVFTALSELNLFLSAANNVNDAFYQTPGATNENIVIIGIDSKSLEEFGSWPWDRQLMADAINYLNEDPQNAPAVIGVDVVFDAKDEPKSDEALIKAMGKLDNVVLSSYATIGSSIVESADESFYIDPSSTLDIVEPFDELKEVTMQGHVNAMLDTDGILRHAIWEINGLDGESVPAFHRVLAEEYCASNNLPLPTQPYLDDKGRWYVLQQAQPGAYSDGISFADLVSGTVDSQFFAGKVVLIGPYDTSFKDEYLTAIDHAEKMAGVEYQANAVGALLADDRIYEARVESTILLFIISFLALFILPFIRLIPAAITSVIVAALWIFACLVAFENGVMITIIYVPIALVLAYIITIVVNYFMEVSQRKYLASTFKRYVAPEIVNELLKGDPKTLMLGGDLVDVAVIFVDVREFTPLASKLAPKKVVEMLNRILTLTTNCVINNKGTLDKYIGDCTMAFWGAPLKQDDCAYKAVKTALEIQEQMNEISHELKQKYGHEINFGIGINYGQAVVGNIGATTHMNYTIIGDVVNTASRLENSARANEILVSASIANLLFDRVRFTYLGTEIKLKGKDDDFEIYKVEELY